MRRFICVALSVSILLLVSLTSAQQAASTSVPNLIRFSGVLRDGGAPASTTQGVTFAIYKEQEGGAPIWMETQNVTPDTTGHYSVLLGSTTASGLPGDLFSQQEQRWLGVQVQGQPEQERVLLVSVPYAFKAHEAETLGGKSLSDFVLAKDLDSNGGMVSANSAGIAAPSAGKSPATQAGVKPPANSAGPTNFSGSTTDQVVGVTQSGAGTGLSVTASGNAIFGNSTIGANYGVWGQSRGVGGFGVLGTAISSTGAAIGVKGSSTSPSGTGVRGIETSTTGGTAGVSAYVSSLAGTAGVFNNAAGGEIITGQNNGVEKFSVDGSGNVNTTSTYRIGGSSVLNIGNSLDQNLFLGVGTGTNDVAQSGKSNVFVGYNAGYNNSTGSNNTFSGIVAGYSNTAGVHNTFFGGGAGYNNTTGSYNTFSGDAAGYNNTTGHNDVFAGIDAGVNNASGNYNVFFGGGAGASNTTGSSNTFAGDAAGFNSSTATLNAFYGDQAGFQNTTGSYNTFAGPQAGYNNTTGNSDVYIANYGPGLGMENNTIRIGNQGTGVSQQNATFIAGIAGATVTGVAVHVNTSTGQLGVVSSSRRFKEQIRDMGDSTNGLMKLRPVTFFYKPEYDKGECTLQYGLIAEEVAEVYPELVAYEPDGKPYTVKYQYLTTMLLNEMQKRYHRAEAEAKVITQQQDQSETLQRQNEEFQQRLSRLEGLMGAGVQTFGQERSRP